MLRPRTPRVCSVSGMLVLLAAISGVAAAQSVQPARVDSVGTIVGVVRMKDGGFPLAYSVSSIPGLGRERFSNDQGVFVLADLPAGVVQLRVRHLGYSPADLSVTVHAGRTDTIHVELAHIAVRLTAMQVRAYPPCTTPGVPHSLADSGFTTVFEQLRLNADQFRLLTATYPYVSTIERMMTNILESGDSKIDVIDTLTLDSRVVWTYKPGAVVISEPSQLFGPGTMFMNIPTLVHFADQTFLDNHCFYNGGLETIDGTELLRIDFTAAARIPQPDVNGSMYLDPLTFQIRRSLLRLSRIPRGVNGLRETEATTYFGEIFQSISVIAGIESVNRLDAPKRRPKALTEAHEQQRLLRVNFLNGTPGGDVKKP